jgi:hypothetical protein
MKTIAKQLVLISIGALFLTGCATMHRNHAYEYKTYDCSVDTSNEAELNKLGKEGWVLVGYTYVPAKQTGWPDRFHYVFMRHEK